MYTTWFIPFNFLFLDGLLRKEHLVILLDFSQLIAKKFWNTFHTYVDGSTDRSQMRTRGRTPAWSIELAFPFPYGAGIQTGIWDRASAWNNKWRATFIFSHTHANILATNVPPPPCIRTPHAHHQCWWTGKGILETFCVNFQNNRSHKVRYWLKNRYLCIKSRDFSVKADILALKEGPIKIGQNLGGQSNWHRL